MEEKELMFDELEAIYECLVDEFQVYLEEEVKLTPRQVRNYCSGANMVCNSALYGCLVEPSNLSCMEFIDAFEYLGVHKFYISSVNFANELIKSFKHFANFLLSKSIISKEAYDDIISEIKIRRKDWIEAVKIRLDDNDGRDVFYELIMGSE